MPDARALVGTSAVVTAGTLSLAELQQDGELPDTRRWVALAIVFLIASVFVDLGAGGIGGGLALLLMVATILTRGDQAIRYLTKQTRPPRRRGARRRNDPLQSEARLT